MLDAPLGICANDFLTALEWQQAAYDAGTEFLVTRQDKADLEHIRQCGYGLFCQRMTDMLHTTSFAAPTYFTVPKDGGGFREVLHIPTFDKLVFLTTLLADRKQYSGALAPYQGTVDYSRPLQDTSPATWFTQYKAEYKAFRLRTEHVQASGQPLVLTDIAKCGPSCNLDHLARSLHQLGGDAGRVGFIHRALKYWAAASGQENGLPPGFSFSDMLLKLYLLPLDHTLTTLPDGQGWRYADDIRITGNSVSAREGNYIRVIQTLNDLGMRVNSAKERRLDTTTPRTSDTPDTVDIFGQHIDPIWDWIRNDGKHKSARDFEALPKRLLIELTNAYLIDTPDISKTLFNFIINRVSKHNQAHDTRHIMIPAQSLTHYVTHTSARLDQTLKYCRAFLPKTSQEMRRASAAENACERYQALYDLIHTPDSTLNSPYIHWQFLQSVITPYVPAFAVPWVTAYATQPESFGLAELIRKEAQHALVLKPHAYVPQPVVAP